MAPSCRSSLWASTARLVVVEVMIWRLWVFSLQLAWFEDLATAVNAAALWARYWKNSRILNFHFRLRFNFSLFFWFIRLQVVPYQTNVFLTIFFNSKLFFLQVRFTNMREWKSNTYWYVEKIKAFYFSVGNLYPTLAIQDGWVSINWHVSSKSENWKIISHRF